MRKMVLLVFILLVVASAGADDKKPGSAAVPNAESQSQTAGEKPELPGVPLTPADVAKLQPLVDRMELTRARYESAIAGFNQGAAEVIGDHGLRPSNHAISQDGRFIVPKPKPKQ